MTAAEFKEFLIQNSAPEIIKIMKDQDGWEMVEGFAEICERVSDACDAFMETSTPGKAAYGAYSNLVVSFARTGLAVASLGTGTILKGRTGIRFTLLEDIDFGVNDLGPYSGSCKARIKSTHGNLLAGEVLFIESTPDGTTYDPTITATVVSASGGKGPTLEWIGNEKGMAPALDETEAQFKKRFRTMSEFGSLPVITAAVRAIFPTAQIVEAANMAFFADYSYTWDWPVEQYNFQGDVVMDVPTNGYIVLIPFQVDTQTDWCFADIDAFADYSYCGIDDVVSIDLGDGLGDVSVNTGSIGVWPELERLNKVLSSLTVAGVWHTIMPSEVV